MDDLAGAGRALDDDPVGSTGTVTIRFQGQPLEVRAGTSVAVALWERGVRILSHSPKYGRPRGLHCARGHCTSCLVRIDGVPNVRACLAPVVEGMQVERQDAGAMYAKPLQKSLELGGELFPPGFYYKWFTRPRVLSSAFLSGLRPLTGVGRLPSPEAWNSVPETRAEDLGGWDQVIVGGGLSGLRATLRSTGRVLLVDDHAGPGGQRWPALQTLAADRAAQLDRFPVLRGAHRRLEEAVAAFAGRPDLDRRLATRVVAGYQPGGLVLKGEHGLSMLTTDAVTWAAGALDVQGLFPGNDLPGIVGPRALYRMVTRDGMNVRGRHAVVVGGGLDLWLSALLLHARGAQVTVVVTESGWQTEVSAAIDSGWQFHSNLELTAARSHSRDRLSLAFAPAQGPRSGPGSRIELDGELVVMARRGKPVYDVVYQLGGDLVLQPELGGFLPAGAAQGRYQGRLPGGVALTLLGEAAGAVSAEVVTAGEEAVEP
ncbi:MAG: 2Fe-2S iron-sulfur cluster-binding protein [Candidatus Krumholzibacteriia bacterium]